MEVARRWFHQMGFKVKRITKGIYYNGHERADAIEHRKVFLNEMASLGFIHPSNAPNEESKKLVDDVQLADNWENTGFTIRYIGFTMRALLMPMMTNLQCGRMTRCRRSS